jgi:hypothetical protein
MIVLSNNTVSATADANTTIGILSLADSTGARQVADWALAPSAADYFITSGSALLTARASIPAGFYSVRVRGNAQLVSLKEKAWLVIQVS